MIKQYNNIIIQTVCKFMIPIIQLFALYVIAHGHYSPGGGFQGGCILAASFILMIIAFDIKWMRDRFSEIRNNILISSGVLLYAFVGLICILLGKEFLNYESLSKIIPLPKENIRSLSTLIIEIGVGITVSAVMTSIFVNLSTFGKQDKENI